MFDDKKILQLLSELNSMAHSTNEVDVRRIYSSLVACLDDDHINSIPACVLPYDNVSVELYETMLSSDDKATVIDKLFFIKPEEKKKGFFSRLFKEK